MALGSMLLWLTGVSLACDQGYLTQTKKDFETSKAAADVKFRRLVGSLAESCTFAPTLGSTLTALTGADIPMRPKLEQKVILAEAGAWSSACPGGKAAFDAAFAVTGDAREAALYGPCNVGRYRYAAPGELAKGTGVVFLSILVAKHFEDKQVPDTLSIPLLRALAGLSGAAPATTTTGAAPAATDPWAQARAAVDAIKGKPFEAVPADQWARSAEALLPLCEQVRARPTTERQKNRTLEFETCAEAGRAAENLAQPSSPYFRPLAAQTVNWGYYLAGASAKADPTLVGFAKDPEIKSAVGWYVDQLASGKLPAPQ